MAVRLIKKSWWVDFQFDQKRYRRRSPENTRRGAQAFEAALRQRLARDEPIDNAGTNRDNDLTFEKFARQWFEQYVVANNKFSEQYAKQKILAASLIPFFGRMPLKAINANHVEQYKARAVVSRVSNKTINNRLTVLAKCLRCAHEWHGTDVPNIKKLNCIPPKTDYLTMAECDALLSHTHGQLREMVFLALRKVTWHMLRHTFATQLTLRGVPLTVVRELLGHSSITTTMRYSHVAPAALRSAIELLNPKNAVSGDFGQPAVNHWQQMVSSDTQQIVRSPK